MEQELTDDYLAVVKAKTAARMRMKEKEQSIIEQYWPVFAKGVEEGVAAFGLPVDAINTLLDVAGVPVSDSPVMGSKELMRGMETVAGAADVPTREAERGNLGENVAEIGGSVVVPTSLVLKLAKIFKGNPILSEIAKNPGKFVAAESTGAVSGGTGRTVAENMFPESDIAGMIGELVGIPIVNIVSAVARHGDAGLSNLGSKFSKENQLSNAAKEVQGKMTGTKEDALKNLEGSSSTPIEPGKVSGDTGLIAETRRQNVSDPAKSAQIQEDVFTTLRKDLETTLKGGKEGTVYSDEVKDLMRDDLTKIEQGVEKAQIDSLADASILPNVKKEEVSRIVRANVDQSYSDFRQHEKELWNIKTDIGVDNADNTMSVLSYIKEQGKGARKIPSDIVSLVERFLTKESDEIDINTFDPDNLSSGLKDDVTIKTLQNLRSRVLDEIRDATSGPTPDSNRASLLGKLQEALLDDIASIPDVSDDIARARQFSKVLNDTYNRGKIGDLRGVKADSSLRVDPDLTLQTIVQKAEEGGVNLRQLLAAENSPSSMQAIGDYVSTIFREKAISNGVLDTKAANKFMDEYRTTLEKLPDVRAKIEKAIQSGEVSDLAVAEAKISKDAILKSRTAQFLNVENPVKVIKSIRTGKNPKQELMQLVAQAKLDPSGDAFEGLKSLIYDEVVSQITVKQKAGSVNEISRAGFSKTFTPEYKAALKESGIYDDVQIAGIERIMKDLDVNLRVADQKITGTSGTSQDVQSLFPGGLFGFIMKQFSLRVVAPVVGKGPGSLSSAQAIGEAGKRSAGLLGKVLSKFGLEDPSVLVKRAVLEDKQLLKILIEKIPDEKKLKEVIRKLDSYLLSTPIRGGEEKEEGKAKGKTTVESRYQF